MTTEIDTDNYEFDFGRYKGYSYAYVLNQNPGYIEWLIDKNNTSFALNEADIAILSDTLSAKLK